MKFTPTQDYHWSTRYYHYDNTFTMNDFLDYHLPDNFAVICIDGSYAEIRDEEDNIYAIDTKGNGDSFNHIVTSGILF